MTQTVTESFCERCGTRYAFDVPVIERSRREAVLETLGFGNAAAHAHAAAPLDPFLTDFRFCLECRQYTCPQCWNEAAGFCASCAPFPDAPPVEVRVETAADEQVREVVGADAWPMSVRLRSVLPPVWDTAGLIQGASSVGASLSRRARSRRTRAQAAP